MGRAISEKDGDLILQNPNTMTLPDEREVCDDRVIVMIRDSERAAAIVRALEGAGLNAVQCADLTGACRNLGAGAGAVLIDDRMIEGSSVVDFDRSLADQPVWSDIPVILLSEDSGPLPALLEGRKRLASASAFSILTLAPDDPNLVTVTYLALRARRHQYRVRDLLQVLGQSEERFRLMVESAREYAIFSTDPKGFITSWNPGAQRLLGYDEEEIIGQPASIIFTEDDRRLGVAEKEMQIALTNGVAEDDRWHVRKDGRRFWADGQMCPMRATDGTVRGFTMILRDHTGRRHTESWLRALNETLEKRVEERTAVAENRSALLRRLANELTNAEHRERRRLAQVLHDHLQQLLVAAKMQLGMLATRETNPTQKDSLNQVEGLLKRSIEASRSLTVELSPPVLYDAGLPPALDWLSRRMMETHGLKIEVECETEMHPLEEDIRLFLFEAIRECLFNVVKHAGVNEATVALRRDKFGNLEASVIDRGQGFRVGETVAESGFGLFGIRERIELLGGSFDLKSIPGEGTRVSLRMPVSEETGRVEEGDKHENREEDPPPPADAPVSKDARVRILLADDHKILREGLAGLLREQADFEVVSEASDGQMAINLAREIKPDVIIMDVTMPRLNGIDATRRIVQEMPQIKVIGLSMHEKEDMAKAMRDAGAVAFVTKGAPSDILTATIRDCANRKAG